MELLEVLKEIGLRVPVVAIFAFIFYKLSMVVLKRYFDQGDKHEERVDALYEAGRLERIQSEERWEEVAKLQREEIREQTRQLKCLTGQQKETGLILRAVGRELGVSDLMVGECLMAKSLQKKKKEEKVGG